MKRRRSRVKRWTFHILCMHCGASTSETTNLSGEDGAFFTNTSIGPATWTENCGRTSFGFRLQVLTTTFSNCLTLVAMHHDLCLSKAGWCFLTYSPLSLPNQKWNYGSARLNVSIVCQARHSTTWIRLRQIMLVGLTNSFNKHSQSVWRDSLPCVISNWWPGEVQRWASAEA